MKLDIQKFAVTKNTTFSESKISIENNTSSLTITITFSANNSSTWFTSETLYCTCNGVTKSAKVAHPKGGSVTKSFTFDNIKHNNNGTKVVSWSWNCNTGTSVLGNVSASGTRTLTTINRYGRIKSVVGNTTDSTIAITYESTNANYEYYLDIIKGNDVLGPIYKTYDNLDSSVGEHTINISVESEYFNDYINTTSAPIIYILWTEYSTGSDGDDYHTTINLNNNIVPSGEVLTITEADTTMLNLDWGVFVQNKSKLHIELDATGIYGSNIVSISTTFTEYLQTLQGNNITTNVITTAGELHMVTTIIDSRGRQAYLNETITILPYENPIISIVEAQRCLIDGTIDEDGRYVKYTFVGSISPVANNNSKIFQIGYKKTTDDYYTFETISNAYLVNEEDSITSFTISPDYAYDIIFQATDSFMTTAIGRQLIVGFDLMNFNASGKAMAIGKVSEASANEELLEIDLPTKVLQDMDIASLTINNEPIIVVEDFENYTGATASDTTANLSFDITKIGYIPFGIVGIYSSGSRSSFLNIYGSRLNSTTEAIITYRNTYTQPLIANDTKIKIYVAYIKN